MIMANHSITDLLLELEELANTAEIEVQKAIYKLIGKFEQATQPSTRSSAWTPERREERSQRMKMYWSDKGKTLRFLFSIYDSEQVDHYVIVSWSEAANAWDCKEHTLRIYFSRAKFYVGDRQTLWKYSHVHNCNIAITRLPSGTALDGEQFIKDLKKGAIRLSDFEAPRIQEAKKTPKPAYSSSISSYIDKPHDPGPAHMGLRAEWLKKRAVEEAAENGRPAPLPAAAPPVKPRPQPAKEPADIWEAPKLPGRRGQRAIK